MRLKIKISVLMLFSIVLLTQTLVPAGSWTEDDYVFDKFGPRVDNKIINIYHNTEALMLALQACEIDVPASVVPPEWVAAWSQPPYNDPNSPYYIKMMPVKQFRISEFDLNHKERIDTYPDWTSPMTYQKFRQAIAHLTNKPEYLAEILMDQGVICDTKILPWFVWYNTACDDYYPYNPILAAQALDDGGFTLGLTGVRVYPPGHEKAGQPLDPLILYIRADDPHLMEAGIRIAAKLNAVGIPTTNNILPLSGCYTPVFIHQDYHLYTGYQMVHKDPDYLYDYWHSSMIPWPNFVWYNNPNYDEAAAHVKYATTYWEALQGCKDAQLIFADDVGSIPLWSNIGKTARKGYANHDLNKPWHGFVNEEGVGLYSWWSFLSAHTEEAEPPTGGTITKGVVDNIMKLNPLRSTTEEEWEVLDEVYDTLLKEDPYTFEDLPWEAYSWHVGTYYNTALEEDCTMLTFNLEHDIYWHDCVQFTSADVEFSIEYHRYMESALWYGKVKDVYDVKTVDDYTVVVLMAVKSFWALHWIGELPMIPKHIWENIGPVQVEEDMPDPYLIGKGPFKYEGGEPGTEPGTGVVPSEYVVLSAFEPDGHPHGFFRYCPIKAHGDIDLQGDYPYPTINVMKRTVYAPNDMYGVPLFPQLNMTVPRLRVVNLHAETEPAWTGTWTLTETTTGYVDSETVTLISCDPPVTLIFDSFNISDYPNGPLPCNFTATHTPDTETGRTCSYIQDGLAKTFVGDINGDGNLDVFDALELTVAFILWFNGGKYYANADIDGDGVIGITDAVILDWYL